MAQRPTRAPRWAFGDSAALVEPVSTLAETGFTSGYRPPAQWVNYLLHFALAWVDHLRGPGWGAWTREAHGGTAVAFTAVAGIAADTDDARASAQRYRYAIVGSESGPAPSICASRNGREWQDRSAPTGFSGILRGIACGAGLWVLWGTGTSECWTTPTDTGSNSSAVRTGTAGHWTTLSAASANRVGGVAWNGGTELYLVDRLNSLNTDLVRTSDGGSSWSTATVSWPSSAHIGADIAYDDSRSRYVISSSIGGILTWTPATSTSSGLLATLSGIATDADVRLRVGGPEDARTLLAWASYRHDGTTALSASLVWRSTNGGASWTAITLPSAMSASGGAAIVTDLAHVDGVWIATTTAAPYLWRSDDDGQTWERVALPIGEEPSWALHRAAYADGQVLCTGLTWTVASTRASATSPGTWTSREPSYLADAGYLRGRRLDTTAPTNGQVLSWNAAAARWEAITISTSPTTTRGDLIVRGASADQRLAIGVSARYLRSDGTDPSWAQLAAADLTGQVAVANGGTGSSTASAARSALGVQDSPRLIPLASYESTTSTVDVAIGAARFDPADYLISGRTTTLTLEAIGQVVSGVTSTLTLRNLTDATDEATLSWTETSATRKTASITLPGSAKLYEMRFKKSGGGTSDYAVAMGALIRITWS